MNTHHIRMDLYITQTFRQTKFPEIDVQAASDAAGAKYNSDMADIDRRFDEAGQKSRKRGKAGAGRKRKLLRDRFTVPSSP